MKNIYKLKILILLLFFQLLFISNKANTHTLIGTFFHYWETSQNNWTGEDSVSFTYDTLGRLVDQIYYYGDYPFTGVFTPYNKKTYIYNSNGSLFETLGFYYTTQWDTAYRETNSYDINNRLDTIFYDTYVSLNTWQAFGRAIYTYDINGNKVEEMHQAWDITNSVWGSDNDPKTIYAYDANNYLISVTNQSWDAQLSGYRNITKQLYTNDLNGLHIETLEQVWDGVSNWYDMQKDSSIYNANLKITTNYHRYRHQGGTDQWGFSYKEMYSYNSMEKIDTFLTQYWDTLLADFGPLWAGQAVSEYDADSNIIKLTNQVFDTLLAWRTQDEVYFYYDLGISTFSKGNTSKNDGVNAYPNPFKDEIIFKEGHFKSENVKMQWFDVTGKEVKTAILNKNINGLKVNTNQLPEGIYFIKIQDGENSYIKKMIKVN